MNLSKIFKRNVKVEEPIKPAQPKVVRGLKASDVDLMCEAMHAEYDRIAAEHKKPTEYMKGLKFGIFVLESIKPYNIMEEVHNG